MSDNLVRVERNRGRVSLGRAVDVEPGDLFDVKVDKKSGVITMTPVRVVPKKDRTDE